MATVACFDPTAGELPRRRLDVPRFQQFLVRLAESGVEAVLVGSSTGQGHLRNVLELEELFDCAARAGADAMQKFALLRPEDHLDVNDRLLRLLKQLRYDVVFFRPGTNLAADASEEEIVGNVQPLVWRAAELGLRVGLYSISDVSGVPLTAAVTARLVHEPGGDSIVAVKITEADYEKSTLQFLRHPQLKHLRVVQGWDPHLARALQDGQRYSLDGSQRCSITSGSMAFALFQYFHILDAAEREDWNEVQRAQQAVTLLFHSMQDDPAHFADLQRAKYIMGLGHPIASAVSQQQVQRVLESLSALPDQADRRRLAESLDLMGDGPFHEELEGISGMACS